MLSDSQIQEALSSTAFTHIVAIKAKTMSVFGYNYWILDLQVHYVRISEIDLRSGGDCHIEQVDIGIEVALSSTEVDIVKSVLFQFNVAIVRLKMKHRRSVSNSI